MSEQHKKQSNGTVDQIIEHMTADIQNSDGQYIQLGFTPPPTPNDPINWNEYSQQSSYIPHFGPRTQELPYIDSSGRYLNQNVTYNNYMTQNQIFISDIQSNGYDKHLNIDMHGNKYVVYPNQHPQYVLPNQELPMYMPVYPENREYALFANQDLQMQQQSPEMYIPDNIVLQNQEINNKPSPNHIIENLVGNWAPNNTGTYSPFGNAQTQQSAPNLFDVDIPPLNINQNVDNIQNDTERSDFILKSMKTSVKKTKQVAEVKPMRPSYSDVLTKSAPQNPPKLDKTDAANTKIKNQINKKNNKSEKYSKNTVFNRQTSSGTENKENQYANAQKFTEKSPDASKINLSRKWVSLDDVHEPEQNTNAEIFKDVENSSKSRKNSKKFDGIVKNDVQNANGKNAKKSFRDANTNLGCEWTENEDITEDAKCDDKNVNNKNPTKKGTNKEPRSNAVKQGRIYERSAEKPPGSGKKNQRFRKRENNTTFGYYSRNVQFYVARWSKLVLCALLWLFNLVSDIFSMSVHLGKDFATILWDSTKVYTRTLMQHVTNLLKRVKIFTKIGAYIDKTFGGYSWAFWNNGKKEKNANKQENKNWLNSGLEHNITMPLTGEEAMKRLLACKGKDPYSILGVRPDCTDDDIKRYYKRQAFLVHPDKNPQPGAEEAFKILVHAFDIIGEPERRQSYDRKVAESHQVEQAWSELNDLISQLHQKMEYAANTIRCTNCTKRHRRLSVDRPCYAARMCSQCKIHHSAKEGDIWAESKYMGFLWHYYACMDGAVYDITEWAGCQRKNLKHLRPNSHNVQYRIVLGKQGQGTSSGQRRNHKGPNATSERDADIENFLNNLYSQSDINSSANSPSHSDVSGRSENVKSRKKNKRKK